MWKRFAAWLRCPLCGGALDLAIHEASRVRLTEEPRALAEERGLLDDEFGVFVETAILSCSPCQSWFPVVKGLPVLLPYVTPAHRELERTVANVIPPSCHVPRREAAPGERLVMQSFSAEWNAYDYDGVIWEMSYHDHELRFLQEVGPSARDAGGPFLELGCGLGITTALAHKNFRTDSVGVDLSLAAMRASWQFRDNPFLHFVQASVFYLPFRPETFRLVYSHGVLHHTFSTQQAFVALAKCCAPGGLLYVWVYGPGSINDTMFRRVAYVVERSLRRLHNREGSRWAPLVLPPIAIGYLVFNRGRRLLNRGIQPYSYARALHAARDRFTPEHAHRHDCTEVRRWFDDAGYDDVEVVGWQMMPPADHDDFRRNTGVRGQRKKTDPGGSPILSARIAPEQP